MCAVGELTVGSEGDATQVRVVSVCHWCRREIELREAEDADAFTGVELEAHYMSAHSVELAAWWTENGEETLPFARQEIRRV